MSLRSLAISVAVFIVTLAAVQTARAQFDSLAATVPSTANAVALFDVERLLASPLAAKEGWKDKYDRAFAAGLCAIPPDTNRMILAAQLDYPSLEPRWNLAVADLAEPRSAAMIARVSKGILDPVANFPAVVVRDDSFVVELANTRLGAMAPANRQAVARWLREMQARKTPALSFYLKGALVASDESQIVMAFDLEDAVPPEFIRAKLAASEAASAKKIDLDAAAKALETIRGLAVEIAVTDVAVGRLRVHFSGDATPLAPAALPLILETLSGLGARLSDMDGWKVAAEPSRITIFGPLTTAGMRRVLALIDGPTAAILASDGNHASQTNAFTAQGLASQQYFKSLMSVLEDVRNEAKTAQTFGQNALWFDKWARRIDRMPIQDVDEELLTFGRVASSGLRNMARDMRGIGINTAAQNAQNTAYSYYWNWVDHDAQRRAVGAREKAEGVVSARDIYQSLENEANRLRQVLTERYELAF